VQHNYRRLLANAPPSNLQLSTNLGEQAMLMNLIIWIVLGGLAGWIASILMRRNAQMGLLANIVVGIVGALIGGFIMNLFGASGTTGLNLYSLIVAVIGAVVLLFVIGLFRRGQAV
jgi:uncharacterized membrane protein YeaQ/YmgE (transglycosylase-associated protein family)